MPHISEQYVVFPKPASIGIYPNVEYLEYMSTRADLGEDCFKISPCSGDELGIRNNQKINSELVSFAGTIVSLAMLADLENPGILPTQSRSKMASVTTRISTVSPGMQQIRLPYHCDIGGQSAIVTYADIDGQDTLPTSYIWGAVPAIGVVDFAINYSPECVQPFIYECASTHSYWLGSDAMRRNLMAAFDGFDIADLEQELLVDSNDYTGPEIGLGLQLFQPKNGEVVIDGHNCGYAIHKPPVNSYDQAVNRLFTSVTF